MLGLIPGYWKMRADREQLELSKKTFTASVAERAQQAAQEIIEQQMSQIETYTKRLEKLEKDLDEERTKRMELAGQLDIERSKRQELARQLGLEQHKNLILEEKLIRAEQTISANEQLIAILSTKIKALERDTGELKQR